MSRDRVLVTGAGALLGQGIIRSLQQHDAQYEVIACDPSPVAVGLYWTPNRHRIPLAKDPNWLAAFSALLDDVRPDAVLVGTDVELRILAENRVALEEKFSTKVVVSSPEVVAIADDKYLTYQFLKSHGFDAPDSCLPGGEVELIQRVGFPLVVKPRVGARSVGLSVVRNQAELKTAIEGDRDIVIQECVATDEEEYTAGAICFAGACKATIVMRRELRDGNTYRAWVDDFPELNAFVERVTTVLKPHGPVNFQFRLHDGRPKIFEINGRFSGTTPLRMRAGFDEVDMVLRHVLHGDAVTQPTVTKMMILRYLTETVVLPHEPRP